MKKILQQKVKDVLAGIDTANALVIDRLDDWNVSHQDSHYVRDYGIRMFKLGHDLGLSGLTYEEFQEEGKKILNIETKK